ncbi:MAG: hypothetical protein EBZ36_02285 [Acidobacteria bacterium]|nr:hypothetical protein [Acidobacteriota bacterium]
MNMIDRGEQLQRIIDLVRRRRRLLIWAQGITLTVGVAAISILLLGLISYRFRTSGWLVPALRLVALSLIAASIYLTLWRPLRRKVHPSQIARLIEEKVPGIEDRFVTAVEVAHLGPEPKAAGANSLRQRLMDDADHRAAGVPP